MSDAGSGRPLRRGWDDGRLRDCRDARRLQALMTHAASRSGRSCCRREAHRLALAIFERGRISRAGVVKDAGDDPTSPTAPDMRARAAALPGAGVRFFAGEAMSTRPGLRWILQGRRSIRCP
jgi:cobalt-precorrin-5B (C1)-methyltransferase